MPDSLAAQILTQIHALRTSVDALSQRIGELAGPETLAESIRTLASKVAAQEQAIATMHAEITTLQATPGNVALSWVDRIGVTVGAAIVLGVTGTALMAFTGHVR